MRAPRYGNAPSRAVRDDGGSGSSPRLVEGFGSSPDFIYIYIYIYVCIMVLGHVVELRDGVLERRARHLARLVRVGQHLVFVSLY